MQDSGIFAVGVDRSFYRFSRWLLDGLGGRRLVVADAAALPFQRAAFESVIASGMLEHVGVEERTSPYRVRALETKRELRRHALQEMLRVSSAAVVADFPNGWFPVDFWHGETLGAFRLHGIPDVLNPSLREVRSYADGARVTVLPLGDRLRFRQVTTKSWGRAFAPAMRAVLRFLDWLPRRTPFLSVFYPFLVLKISAHSGAGAGSLRTNSRRAPA